MRVDGKKIRKLRKALGISQKELGISAGVSHEYIHYIEVGKKIPSVTVFAYMAQCLGVTTDDLLKKEA